MVRWSTLMLALTMLAAPALADGWDNSFPPAALAGHFTPGETVMVVRGGAPSDETTGAATALIVGLKAAGAKPLDDSALGDVSALDDAAIVTRALQSGASEVAVVRAAQGKAVAAFYGQGGAPRGTVTGSPAQIAAAPEQQPATSVPPAAPDAQRKQATARFEREFVGFGTTTQETWNGPQPVFGAYQGSGHRTLEMPEFFDLVGRHDLAERYASRASRRETLLVGGGVVILVALASAAAIIGSAPVEPAGCTPSTCDAALEQSRQTHFTTGAVVGVVGGVIGAGVAGAGYLTDPMPVSEAEAIDLAKQHDDKLKHDLGIGALQLRPQLAPGGAKLALGFTF